jgi:hypothetical protein
VFEVRGAVLALTTALVLAGCRRGAPVTGEECDRLLDRYVELLLRQDDPKVGAAEINRHQVETRIRATSNGPFLRCRREVSREQMDCALAAYNPDEIERCMVPIP